ncbi:ABC transporter substrate-binding protein [Citreimonas sp.]|uniref:ABC transporter substrate-binding protein n=1 Tax=Citreimonas sp. TaxID=3036715 RepID=UPI004058BD88
MNRQTKAPHLHSASDLHRHCCGGDDGVDLDRRHALDMLAKGGLAAMMGPLASSLATAAAAQDDDVLRISYLPITDATPLLVAHAMGYFADEGIEAEDPTLIRGWSPLIEGFAAGRFNLVHFLKPIPVWMRYNNDFPVKIMAWAHTNGSALVVGKQHADVTDFSGLGGKQVAVPFWYSMHNIVLQYALRDAGIKPVIQSQGDPLADDECNLQVLPPPEMPPALAAGQIDAYIVAEPFNAMGELLAGARMLRFTGDIWKNHPCCVVCMNEQPVSAKPEWTQGVMNALVRASIYASQNKAEVAGMLSRDGKGYLPAPAEVVQRAMTLYEGNDAYIESGAIQNQAEFNNGRIDFAPWPYPSATRMIVEAMNETLVSGDTRFLEGLDPAFVAEDLVDYEFVRKALEQYPDWQSALSIEPGGDPFSREEILKL